MPPVLPVRVVKQARTSERQFKASSRKRAAVQSKLAQASGGSWRAGVARATAHGHASFDSRCRHPLWAPRFRREIAGSGSGGILGLRPVFQPPPWAYFATITMAGRTSRSLSRQPFCTTSSTVPGSAVSLSRMVMAWWNSGSKGAPRGSTVLTPNFSIA